LRALVSAHNIGANWDLRCELREKLIAFLQQEYPLALPRSRNETVQPGASASQPPEIPLSAAPPRQ